MGSRRACRRPSLLNPWSSSGSRISAGQSASARPNVTRYVDRIGLDLLGREQVVGIRVPHLLRLLFWQVVDDVLVSRVE